MDPVRSFIDLCLEPVLVPHLPSKSDLFKHYKQFCLDYGYNKTVTQNTLISRIKAALPQLVTARKTVPGTNSQEKLSPCLFGLKARGDINSLGHYEAEVMPIYREGGFQQLKVHTVEPPTIPDLQKYLNKEV